jgi:biopolymer transport protein TolR
MAMQSNGSGRPLSEINVTPMVDVMLVLLIIFMITAPFIQQGVSVQLPQTKAAPLESSSEHAVLSITHNKHIFLGDTEISYASLHQQLSGNIKLQQDKHLYLHADRRLPYGFVVDVMATIKEAGIENVGMVTDPTNPSAP